MMTSDHDASGTGLSPHAHRICRMLCAHATRRFGGSLVHMFDHYKIRGGFSAMVGAASSSSMDAGPAGVPRSGGGGGHFSVGAPAAGSADPQLGMMMAHRELREMNQLFSLQYLSLQQRMQGEDRQFSALSNVMKAKHDTARAAINNVR